MKTLPIQTNFTAGELTPRLYGHVDIAKYKNGLKTATNCKCLPHGPIARRNGFKYKAQTKTMAKKTRLIRFQFNQSNAYILEFGDLYIRFYTAGGQVLSGGLPYTVVTTYLEAELPELTYVQFGRLLYIFHANHAPAILTWTNSTSWTLADVIFYPPATIEGGVKPAATLTPAATSGTGINFTASVASFNAADVGRQLQNLSGAGIASITAFTSTTVVVATILTAFPTTAAIASQSWKMDLSPVATLTPSGSREGAMITLTASSPVDCFRRTGQYILIHNGVVKITSLTSSTVANGEVQKSLDAVSATSAWTEEDPAWSSTYGYPSVCTLYQQRLMAASTSQNPQTVWGSPTGIYDSMGVGSGDSDAVQFDLSSKEISSVSWMADIRGQLAIGTSSGEITISGGGSNAALTPSNIDQQVRGYHGSNLQQVIGLDDQVIYVQRSGRKINAFRYDFQIDNYVSEDLLFLAEHLTRDTTIVATAFAQDPDSQLYAVLENGDMLVCTYIREQQVVAWVRWQTDGAFESVSTISTGATDEVWVVVKRTINGSTVRYVEQLDISTGESNTDGFSDCYLTYSDPKTITGITNANPGVLTSAAHGFNNDDKVKIFDTVGMEALNGVTLIVKNKTANTFQLADISGTLINTTDTDTYAAYVSGGSVYKLVTTISGLSHLEGETVQVKADGAVHPDCTVSGGAITLERLSYEATVGLPYTTTIETLPREYNLGLGSQQGQQSRWVRPILRFYKTCIPTINGEFRPARAPTDLMDNKLNLFTGDIVYSNLTWRDGFSDTLSIESTQPLPLTLLGIFGSLEGGTQ